MNRPHFSALSLASLLFAASLPAQEAPTPAPELKKLAPLAGKFTGTGTAQDPDGGEVQWEATSQARWILDGFWLESVTTIEVGADAAIQMRSIMGWDAEHRRYVSFNYANHMGGTDIVEPHWVNSKTLVESTVRWDMGAPNLSRSITTITDDGFDLRVEEALGTGKFRTTVTGSFDRVSDDAGEITLDDTAFMFGMPPAPEMRELRGLVGDYDGEGWMVMPGMGRMDLTGGESIKMRAGGHAMEFMTHGVAGEGPRWEGRTWVSWNPHRENYRMVMFSNYGEVSAVEMEWVDDGQMLSYGVGRMMGMPMLGRTVVTMGEHGPQYLDSHAIYGVGEPEHVFHMDYSPRKKQ